MEPLLLEFGGSLYAPNLSCLVCLIQNQQRHLPWHLLPKNTWNTTLSCPWLAIAKMRRSRMKQAQNRLQRCPLCIKSLSLAVPVRSIVVWFWVPNHQGKTGRNDLKMEWKHEFSHVQSSTASTFLSCLRVLPSRCTVKLCQFHRGFPFLGLTLRQCLRERRNIDSYKPPNFWGG